MREKINWVDDVEFDFINTFTKPNNKPKHLQFQFCRHCFKYYQVFFQPTERHLFHVSIVVTGVYHWFLFSRCERI